jgi:hypothetical protein
VSRVRLRFDLSVSSTGRGADDIENTASSIVVCRYRVYRAVAWERVDQIRYIIYIVACSTVAMQRSRENTCVAW